MARVEKDARLTCKGQVTLPAAIRRATQIDPGDRLRFSCENGVLLATAQRAASRFGKYRGIGAGVPGGRRTIQR